MNDRIYESPGLTVLGTVAELTEEKGPGEADQAGLDGISSTFTPPND